MPAPPGPHPGPRSGRRTRVDHAGEGGVEDVPLRGEEEGVERVAGDQHQLLGSGLHDGGAGRHHPVVDDRVVEGPARRDHRDSVPRCELLDAAEPGDVVGSQHRRAR